MYALSGWAALNQNSPTVHLEARLSEFELHPTELNSCIFPDGQLTRRTISWRTVKMNRTTSSLISSRDKSGFMVEKVDMKSTHGDDVYGRLLLDTVMEKSGARAFQQGTASPSWRMLSKVSTT